MVATLHLTCFHDRDSSPEMPSCSRVVTWRSGFILAHYPLEECFHICKSSPGGMLSYSQVIFWRNACMLATRHLKCFHARNASPGGMLSSSQVISWRSCFIVENQFLEECFHARDSPPERMLSCSRLVPWSVHSWSRLAFWTVSMLATRPLEECFRTFHSSPGGLLL